ANASSTAGIFVDLPGSFQTIRTPAVTIAGTLDLGGTSHAINVIDGLQNVHELQIDASIINGRLVKQGLGTLVLNGNNVLSPQNELQRYSFTGAGSYRLAFAGQTTSSILTNASSAGDIQTALQALPTIGFGNVIVSSTGPAQFDIAFQSSLASVDAPALTFVGTTGSLAFSGTSATQVLGGQQGLVASSGTIVLSNPNAVNGPIGVIGSSTLQSDDSGTILTDDIYLTGGDLTLRGTGDLTLAASASINPLFSNRTLNLSSNPSAQIEIAGAINLAHSFTLGLNENVFNHTSTISGVIDDPLGTGGTVTKSGSGAIVLTGANTFDANLSIANGSVEISDAAALGSIQGTTDVTSGGSLILQAGTVVNDILRTNGSGIFGVPTGALRASGDATVASALVLQGNSTISSDQFVSLVVDGPVAGGATLTKVGAGTLALQGASHNAINTLTINDGTVVLNKPAGYDAVAGSIQVGNETGLDSPDRLVQIGQGNQIANTATVTVASTGSFSTAPNLSNDYLGASPLSESFLLFFAAGSPQAGTFTLRFNGFTTANIAYNASAGEVKTALESLASIGAAGGSVNVDGVPGKWTIEFGGTLGAANVVDLAVNTSPVGATATLVKFADGVGNEVLTLGPASSATNVTFSLNGSSSSPVLATYNTATALNVQTALESIPGVGAGNVTVVGNPTNGFNVIFTNNLGLSNLPNLTVSGSGLLPTVTVTSNGIGREVQQLSLSGASAGSAVFDVGGARTAPQNWNSLNANSLRTILENLSTVGVGNVTVIGPSAASATATYHVIFNKNIAGINLPQVLVDNSAFTTATATFTQASDNGQFNESQRIKFNATAGSYALAFGGQSTGNLAFDSSSGTVQAALQGLSTIGAGNVVVTGTPGSFAIYFAGALGNQNVDSITIDGTNLIGSAVATATTFADGGNFGDEQQTIELLNVTGGNYRLVFGRFTTQDIAANASATVVQAALESLPPIGLGNVVAMGDATTGFSIRFTGEQSDRDVAQLTAVNIDLTGVSPAILTGTQFAGFSQETIGGFVIARGMETAGLIDTGNNVINLTNASPISTTNFGLGVASNAPILNDSALAATIAGNIDLAGTSTRTVTITDAAFGGRSADLVLAADITGGTGPTAFNKAGSGHLQITGKNRFLGNESVVSGILSLAGDNGSLPGAHAISIAVDATLLIDNRDAVNSDRLTNGLNHSQANLTLNGGTLEFVGNSTSAVNEAIPDIVIATAPGQPATIRMTNQAGQPLQVVASNLTIATTATLTFMGGADDLGTANNRLIFTNALTLVNNTLVNGLLVGANDLDFVTHGVNGIAPAPFVTDIASALPTDNVKATASQTIVGTKTINALMVVGDGLVIGTRGSTLVSQTGKIVNVGGTNTYDSDLSFGSNTALLQVDLGSSLVMNGNLLGNGPVRKELSGSLTLSPSSFNFFTNVLTINQGTLRAQSDAAFGPPTGGVIVSSGATLELDGSITIGSETLTLNGGGVRDEVQIISVTGATTGTFQLVLGDATTAPIAYNAPAETVRRE
ncbi:MAG: hypothetical protein JNM18_03090, partial [Planctomycetaceae bacterium]|nr:hypothetical protein [Planctomycetaceae bacterium]